MKRETADTIVRAADADTVVTVPVSSFDVCEKVTVTVEERHNYTDARADIIRNSDLIGIYKEINDGAVPTEEQLAQIVEYVGEHFAPVYHALERLIRDMD
ncbi:hypothetical protein LCGC14_1090710 [marine sediment metagenome]|uniref:Uncharacterized protein n=1 Tax=marine sediment metagenome TaxID=412755 RepID=A0A0F9PVM7_9ZZZZ